MYVEDVLAAEVVLELADGLQERLRLDVTHGPADLHDDDVGVALPRHPGDPLLDLIGDVRDDLHRGPQVIASSLLGDDLTVDLARGDVAGLGQGGVGEALVMAEVEVGLGAIVGDEHLAVLLRAHRPGIDVDVGVEFLERDF